MTALLAKECPEVRAPFNACLCKQVDGTSSNLASQSVPRLRLVP